MQPVTLCQEATEIHKGDVAPCDGVLWSISETREALYCRSVELPHLQALIQYTQEVYDAKETALVSRALSAEQALKSVPEPMKTSTIIIASVAVVAVGFLGGLTVGILQ